MSFAEIKEKLENAYNEENWNIIEDLIEALSYEVEVNDPYGYEEDDDEID